MKEYITKEDFRGAWATKEVKETIRKQVNKKINKEIIPQIQKQAFDEAIDIVFDSQCKFVTDKAWLILINILKKARDK